MFHWMSETVLGLVFDSQGKYPGRWGQLALVHEDGRQDLSVILVLKLRCRSSFRGLRGRWHFQESPVSTGRGEKKRSVLFSMELAFQKAVEKL